jgi:hypothetical protein
MKHKKKKKKKKKKITQGKVLSSLTKDGYNPFKAYRDLRLYFIEQPIASDGEGGYNLSITNVTQNLMCGYR